MDDTWLQRLPFLGRLVAFFRKHSKSARTGAIRATGTGTVMLTAPARVAPGTEPVHDKSFSLQTRWRYNLDALEEMLKERVSETAGSGTNHAEALFTCDSLARVDPEEVRCRIMELNHIPVLKSVSQRFQMASSSAHADLKELSEYVRRDPGLNTKILRMINSSFFNLETEVTDIEHAMVLLGLDRIRFMAQTLGTVSELNRFSTGFDLRHLWSHSFACGLLAEHLSQHLELPELVHAYSAGLLHDVGKIILSSMYPDAYRTILRMSHKKGFNLNLAERHVFGCDHEQAGGLFAEAQKLPPAISQAMRHHGNPLAAPDGERDTAAIMFLANHFAKEHRLGFSGNPCQATVDELVPAVRCLSSGPLDHCPDDMSARVRISLLDEFVYRTVPGIQKEVDELLRVTFGRSLPAGSHSPVPFRI